MCRIASLICAAVLAVPLLPVQAPAKGEALLVYLQQRCRLS